jgi:Zn-dependent protease with chaperone function
MMVAVRAVLSVALLLGFYVYAAGLVLLFGVPAVWLLSQGQFHEGTQVLTAMTLLTAGAVGYATWQVVRAPFAAEPGLVLTEQRAPALWAIVRELAAGVGTRPPDEIRLVAMVNAAVTEHSRWLGLVGGRRYLLLGLPLLQAMTVAQVRATLAHELGHYSHQHVRLGEPVNRGRYVILQTLAHLGNMDLPMRARLPIWLLRGYAWAYFLVSASVSRAQEVEADRAAVRLAGRHATISEQREYPGLTAAWRFYLNNYVLDGLDSGFAPAEVFSYFPTFLAARAAELDEIRAQAPPAAKTRWDTHPSDAERIALMAQAPEGPYIVADRRPASILLPHIAQAAAQLEELTFAVSGRTRVPFDRYRAEAVQREQQRQADWLYRGAARVAGSASLAAVLDLLAAGRLWELVAALLPPSAMRRPPEALEQVTAGLAHAIAVALVRAGAAGWRHPWSGDPALVDNRGEPLDVWDLADRAIASEAVKVRDVLLTMGANLVAAAAVQTTADASGAEALAGITNAVVNRERRDVIVTSTGLVILPTLPWLRQNTVQQRMRKLLAEVPVPELVTRPEHRYIPYEEIATGALTRRFPPAYEFVLRSGERLRIRFGRKSDEVGEGWVTLARAAGLVGQPL